MADSNAVEDSKDTDVLKISGCPPDLDLKYFEIAFLGQLKIKHPELRDHIQQVNMNS